MNRFFKKIAVVLAMAIVFAAMPMSVFAETNAATVNNATELANALADTNINEIIFGSSITTDTTINVSRNLTIKGEGNALIYTGSGSSARAITVESGAPADISLVIENLTVDCTATYCQRGINFNQKGNLSLNTVTVKGTNVTYAVNLPGSSDNSVVSITNCNLTANIALNIWGENCQITATDTVFTSVDNSTAEDYSAVVLNNDSTTIANGTTVNIIGGKITAENENGEPSNATSNSTASGTITVSDTTEVNGMARTNVAVVTYSGTSNVHGCATVQAAFNKASEDANATVKLLNDVTLTDAVTVNGAVKFDDAGKTITGSFVLTDAAASIETAATLTVTTDIPEYVVKYENGKYFVAPCTHSTVVTIDAVASTCAATGLTAGEVCADCGKVITAQQTVAAKGHVWGYNTQYDAAAHWDYCHICGAQNTAVAHSDVNGDSVCDCGWSMTSAPNRANPNTGVTAEMLK